MCLNIAIHQDKQSAMDSCKLNGAEIDNHIIRVDAAGLGKSKPGDSQTSQQHDQSRAVFLGNVKFNEQEDNIRKHFEKCGYILDVRLVRDTSTGIGKGFGYVNFDSGDSVEKVSFQKQSAIFIAMKLLGSSKRKST